MDSEYLRSLALSSLRVAQVAHDRGYIADDQIQTLDESILLQKIKTIYETAKESNQSLAEVCHRSYIHKNGSSQILKIYFLDRNWDTSKRRIKMVSTDQIKALKELYQNEFEEDLASGVSTIIISPNKWSPQAKKESLAMIQNLTLFDFIDLVIRIPEHESQVPHSVVNLEEIQNHVGHSIQVEDLPLILSTDPAVRWFGWTPGTLLRIDRPGFTSYRRVVS